MLIRMTVSYTALCRDVSDNTVGLAAVAALKTPAAGGERILLQAGPVFGNDFALVRTPSELCWFVLLTPGYRRSSASFTIPGSHLAILTRCSGHNLRLQRQHSKLQKPAGCWDWRIHPRMRVWMRRWRVYVTCWPPQSLV